MRAGFKTGIFCLFLIRSAVISQGVPCRVPLEADGETWYMDCYSNYAIDEIHPGLDRLVIVIHGADINGDDYYENMVAAGEAAENNSSMIVSVQFHTGQVDGSTLYWSSSWREGADSRNGPGISNFTMLDYLIEGVTALNPEIKKVVVVGHSAGGQVVSRYSAGSHITENIRKSKGVSIYYIIANPSSYLYMNNERWVEDSEFEFEVPAAGCSEYNEYHYGLESGLNAYMSEVGSPGIVEQFKNRNIAVLLGDEDTGSGSLDQRCPADLQGSNRFERGNVYYAYLKHLMGAEITATHKLGWAPGVGHNNYGMWQSDCGMYFIFETGECNDPESISWPVAVKKSPEIQFHSDYNGRFIKVPIAGSGNYQITVYQSNGTMWGNKSLYIYPSDTPEISLADFGLPGTRAYFYRVKTP